MPDIVIYTQPWCPYCSAAKALLDRKGVMYREVHAPHGTPEREESIRRSGGRTTVPQIFVGESAIGGSDDLHALEAAGRLDALLTSG